MGREHVRTACEGATGFKMIPQQERARKKTIADNSRFSRGSGAATDNIQKASERHSVILLAMVSITVN